MNTVNRISFFSTTVPGAFRGLIGGAVDSWMNRDERLGGRFLTGA